MRTSRIDLSFFRSKVAKRIFSLFIGCILLPLIFLSYLSFKHVTKQLIEQSFVRIEQAAKAHGVAISERFISLEADLNFIAAAILTGAPDRLNLHVSHDPLMQNIARHFSALFLLNGKNVPQLLWGKAAPLPPQALQPADADQQTGKASILFLDQQDAQARILIKVPFTADTDDVDYLVAEVNPVFIWGIGSENILPPMTDLCILDQSRKVLASSFPLPPAFVQKMAFSESRGDRHFEYSTENNTYLASFWPLYLRAHFDTPNITIILRQAKSDVLAPMLEFKKIFPLVVMLSLWVVLLLSIVFIRRSLVPLEKLKEGTLALARGDFKNRISVASGDEFEDLANSFNEMAGQIDQQIKALLAISEINQSILSSQKTHEIIDTALNRLFRFFHCERIAIILFHQEHKSGALRYSYGAHGTIDTDFLEIPADAKQRLYENPLHLFWGESEQCPNCFVADGNQQGGSSLLLPLFNKEQLTGILAIKHSEKQQSASTNLNQARQIADQLAIALTNAALVEELERLNWGTLEALARTVDAKSPWTAGHSERVTDLARKTARFLGCDDLEIDMLQRAALIHDIGKIGIPRALLDKPDRLSDEEYRQVMEHPLIGARILEPIGAFREIIPIILQHHERYDGSGYPQGLAGSDICLGARILAVTDMYDALISERPYRQGWVQQRVLELINQEAGKQFDPRVVSAFLIAISDGQQRP